MKKIGSLLTLLSCALMMQAQHDTARPWTFWYWMYGAVSEAGIRADLQGMKDVGLGGCYLMPIRGASERPEYGGEANQLSERFWQVVDCALQQADSLGLDMGIHVCDGFALAGGPWITPAESMQKIVFCDTVVGGGRHRFAMPKPEHDNNYYEDLGVYAIPVNAPTAADNSFLWRCSPQLSYSSAVTVNDKGVYCADQPCWLQATFDAPVLVRSIGITPSGTNLQSQRLLVRASDDGIDFYDVKQLTPPRQGWQNTGYNTTFSIPPTRARYFRFEWTPEGTEPGAEDLDAAKWKAVLRLKQIQLSSLPAIDNWEGKAGYVWRSAPETPEADVSSDDYIRPQDVRRLQAAGDRVDITLPKGRWRILRMGHTSTGHTNATAGGGKGLECDKFSVAAVEKQIDNWFGRFMQRPNHRAIKYMHVDSWECGSQNWSRGFADEFRQRRGYDLLPLLPVYAGVPMEHAEAVLRDIRQTINELVNEKFFATVARKARDYGVGLSSESVAPTMMSDGMDHYRYVDVPMGEYWLNSPTHDKPNDMLDAISGAHVYGKKLVQAEGFTEVRGVWNETPAMVKPLLDRNFALGMNRLFFHVDTHNPWTDRKPGMTLDGIGLFFQRDQTWYREAAAFVDYITRCQQLLQLGWPVTDIAVYIGEEIPCRALTPDRLVPMLPGLFGKERVAAERQRLANVGSPMEESPVGVRHSAGIIDMKDWVNALHGYHYDSMNKDALLSQPFGYRVLVVPEGTRLTAAVQARIAELAQQGVTIIDRPWQEATIAGLSPDALLPEGIAYAHRKAGPGDIYFVANQTDSTRRFTAAFRDGDGQAAVCRPVSNETEWTGCGKTAVALSLAPYESVFVLFGTHDEGKPTMQQTVSCEPLAVGSWHILFKENGIEADSKDLFDWRTSADERIRYFSGHARYTTTFRQRKRPDGRVWLTLPDVKDIAHVWVNGTDCGIAWTAPYEVEITKALRKGNNTLAIEVVNTWHNALRGADQGTPPYDGIWTNARYRTKGDLLLPAGLLETPVMRVVYERSRP